MVKSFYSKRLWLLVAGVLATAVLLTLRGRAVADPIVFQSAPTPTALFAEQSGGSNVEQASSDWNGFWQTLAYIAPALLLAAVLGGLVAYRRRVSVFEHDLFHAHILLSVAGALMMLIVGNQLARAFGLLGAASVVRYRYGLRNPRDASLLIIALGIGMATGVGLYALAVSAAAVVFVFSRGLDFFTTRLNLLPVRNRPQLRTFLRHPRRPPRCLKPSNSLRWRKHPQASQLPPPTQSAKCRQLTSPLPRRPKGRPPHSPENLRKRPTRPPACPKAVFESTLGC